ncbi:MAG: type I DNA topoisomerase [Flavobacteriales bacterium]|nr:type I DNA topoisomerase [Flavobacteriales bacterium]
MSKNLVIVESPAKAKTIEGYLGKDFTVKSSYGHVRDLPSNKLAIDIEKGFEPQYEVSSDKKQVISELKKLAKDAEVVWLATDEDREGEAISWHLMEALKLKQEQTKRIVFHEITKPAILKAIENPRTVDINLVNAQQARRVLDRLVGFELSPVLWKKVKPSLSAGRVQSVAVRIIVEREREIINFKTESSYRVVALFQSAKHTFKAELPTRFTNLADARTFLNSCVNASFEVADLEKTPGTKKPAAPFTTSTLQQEASRKLGFSVSRTMVVAQKLYESGKITYMRTDSVNLSDLALNQARDVVSSTYGESYSQTRKFTSKSKGAQEAHEAIRPTDLAVNNASSDRSEQRLYELIWKRTIASQMADAKLEKTTVKIDISGNSEQFVARGEVITFDGFLKVYMEGTDDENNEDRGMLPTLTVGQSLVANEISATERFTHHPPRYTEASLVKKLEELGIGRPSTYAPTISTIQKRNYIEKTSKEGTERKYNKLVLGAGGLHESVETEITGAEKNKLFPTDIGLVVNDFLVDNFNSILDYNFTANVEEQFDVIAEGQLNWGDMIKKFYSSFHDTVETTLKTSERATGERLLGVDPASGKNMFARIGRFGPMVQIGEADDEDKKFASLRSEQSIETITLEEALDLFKLPRKLGQSSDGEEISVAIGRFGPYVRKGKTFASLQDGDDPMTVTLERAIQLIDERQQAASKNIIKTFDEDDTLQVLNGRYGPYVKRGKSNYKIPKDQEPADLTYEQVMELIEKADAAPKRRGKRK